MFYDIYVQEDPIAKVKIFQSIDTTKKEVLEEDIIAYANDLIDSGMYHVMVVRKDEKSHFPIYFRYGNLDYKEYFDKPKSRNKKK